MQPNGIRRLAALIALGLFLFTRISPAAEAPNPFFAYGGSESCRDCHRPEYDLWAKSNHALAERPINQAMDRAAFDPERTIKHASQTSRVRAHAGEWQIVTLGFHTNVEPNRVERVIGNDPVRQFLTPAPGGRWQVHELTYDPKTNEWFDVYGDDDRRTGEWGHWTGRGMNWNSRCADCHNTRLQKNYDSSTDTYHTAMAEMSVGCEACHGPLKAHNDWQKAHPHAKTPDPTITPIDKARMIGACGSCHSRRDLLTGDFVPGDSFYDHFWLEILDQGGRWHPDGQVKDEDYEFESFLSSKMHESGVSCQDCHNPHSMQPLLSGNALCMRCHTGGAAGFTNAPAINPLEHGHHQLTGKGGECVGCHMPVTVYMQRHPRHDHGFTIPDPLLTKQLGVPNACNRCHADKSTDWALGYTDQWYGAKMSRHTRERAQWLASAARAEPAAKDRLTAMLAPGAESPYWRAVAAGFLSQWAADPVVKTTLLKSLKDAHPLVREKTVRSLAPLLEQGDPDATAALNTALTDPMRNVRTAAAWVLRARVDLHSRAGTELLRVLDLDSDQPTGQYKLAALDLVRGISSEGIDHLRRAIQWDPFSPALRYETASVFSQLGRHAEAAEQLQAAARLEPQSAEARYRLGLEYAEQRKFDAATAAFEEAVKLDPQHVQAWFNLALVRSVLGKNAEARAAAQQALKARADFQPAIELLERLPR